MIKNISYLLIVAGMVVALTACSGVKLAGTSATAQAGQQSQAQGQAQNPGQNLQNMPVEGRLAVGTLMLEGTENAVTAAQAKELLPLWKAVKSLSSSTTASTEEINSVYQQIQDTMTAQQIQAIKDASMKPEDTQALMKKYNIQAQQMPTMDPGRLATRQARTGQSGQSGSSAGNAGGFPGGGPGGDMMPPDGSFPGGGMPNAQNAQGTPMPQGTPRVGGSRGGGMNTLFVEPLITLLTERAGA